VIERGRDIAGWITFDQVLSDKGWLSPGAVEIDQKGIITAVSGEAPRDADVTAIGGAAIPGMANLHSHAFQRAMAGLAEHGRGKADSFWTWRDVMYRFVAAITPDDVAAIAGQLYGELLKAGYTSVGEFHYLHHTPDGTPYDDRAVTSRAIVAAARTTGIGLTHLPVLYAAGGFGGAAPGEGQRRFLNSPDELLAIRAAVAAETSGDDNINVGVALHSLRAVPPDMLADTVEAISANDPEAPIHIHIAEQQREVEDCVAWSGKRPVAWLMDAVDIDPRWCLVHATHLSDQETMRLARSGAVAGLCPTTEANLGDGLFPFRAFLDAGGRYGIGSDSHVSTSPVEELRWLEYGQRLSSRQRNIAGSADLSTGAALYQSAGAGGAQALARKSGAIAPGRRADIVVLDCNAPVLAAAGIEALLDAYIFSGNVTPVRDVIVGGNRVVRDGALSGEDDIADAYRRTVARLSAVL